MSAVKVYLTTYNVLAGLAWTFLLVRLVAHLAGDGSPPNASLAKVATLFGYFRDQNWAKLQALAHTHASVVQKRAAALVARSPADWSARASTAFAALGTQVQWVQTSALLEVAHAALGLVRSSPVTTLAQVVSRLVVVWYVLPFFPEVGFSPVYSTMLGAWCVAEIIRYAFYTKGLLRKDCAAIDYLRYSAFYVLYPLGAGSEFLLILASASLAEARWGLPGFFGTYALASVWPPALTYLMSYMHSQRKKHFRRVSNERAAFKRTLAQPRQPAIEVTPTSPFRKTTVDEVEITETTASGETVTQIVDAVTVSASGVTEEVTVTQTKTRGRPKRGSKAALAAVASDDGNATDASTHSTSSRRRSKALSAAASDASEVDSNGEPIARRLRRSSRKRAVE